MAEEIKNLEQLLREHVDPKKKVLASEVSRLTAPGENYLSVVLKVDVVLEDEDTKKVEKLHAVGKCIHSGDVNEMLKQFGGMNYKNELLWYTEILPTLEKFVKEKKLERNFDIFPKLIAYRANLDGGQDVDENSILLMENMTVSGKLRLF